MLCRLSCALARLWSTFLSCWTSEVAYLLLAHLGWGTEKNRRFNMRAYLHGFIFRTFPYAKWYPEIFLSCHDFLLFLISPLYEVPICPFFIFLMIFLYYLPEWKAECYHTRKRANHTFPAKKIILVRKFKLRIRVPSTQCCLNVCLHLQEDLAMKKLFVEILKISIWGDLCMKESFTALL